MVNDKELLQAMTGGIKFGKSPKPKEEDKFHTKAKKHKYVTSSHSTGAARHKTEIRKRVKRRPTQKH